MAAISRLKVEMLLDTDRHGKIGPLALLHSLPATEWVGPLNTQVATGVTEQALVVFGTQGITTVTAYLITTDQNISITYGAAASNVAIPLNANGFHAKSGTSLTEITITNASGSTANLVYLIAGS